jgi:hypothetical protein
MAVTEVTPTTFAMETDVVATGSGGTAINASNTIEYLYPKQGKLLLMILSSHANTAAYIAAGDSGVAKGLGAYTWAVGNAIYEMLIVDSDRHLIAVGDGSSAFKGCISISWHADSAGYIRAWYLP